MTTSFEHNPKDSAKEVEQKPTRIFFIRHGQKDPKTGELTENGRLQIKELSKSLKDFDFVFSSPSARTVETAKELTGKTPETKDEIAYPWASPELSSKLNSRASTQNVEFVQVMLEAFQNPKAPENAFLAADIEQFRNKIIESATKLNQFMDKLLQESPQGSQILIVGHDITGVPAMQLQQGLSIDSTVNGFDFLSGFSTTKNYIVATKPFNLSEISQ